MPRSQKMTPRVSSLDHQHSPCGVMDKRVIISIHAEEPVVNGDAAGIESKNATLAIPRQVSITSSSSSLKALEASVSSLSSFGSNAGDASSSEVRVVTTPPLPPPLPTLSPRRAIFESYWKNPNNVGGHKKTSGQLLLFIDVKEQEKTESPLQVPIPPPPPLVQADANRSSPCLNAAVSAKKDDLVAKDMSPRSAKCPTSPLTTNSTCRRSIFGSSHRATKCSSTTSASSCHFLALIKCDPKLHLTRVGLMLAEQGQDLGSDRGVSCRNAVLADPLSPSKLVSPSAILRPCLKRGSSWTRSNPQEVSAGTCPSTSSSSSEALHDSLNGSEASVHEGRGRSNSTVSFCPTVSVIEFDNSKEVKDEELIRASRTNNDGW
eukprot:CAMPEP_0178622752 /NCGR_PEP_ID=MMETSP0698-20121128/6488_1 /TAXON_ID=265572 /ORGANISM="Extubocellulus spinifer, Strain CCMP396" /LENGTH=376 /DNA_ID=CAMNT_0020261821 /DNA_START=179 /DNA_END=1306 /DNA_ORIENTATION=+